MVGMGVRLKNFDNFDAKLLRFGQHGIGGLHHRITTAVIEIEHRIDDHALFGRRIPH
jgi:hypothetical protein